MSIKTMDKFKEEFEANLARVLTTLVEQRADLDAFALDDKGKPYGYTIGEDGKVVPLSHRQMARLIAAEDMEYDSPVTPPIEIEQSKEII